MEELQTPETKLIERPTKTLPGESEEMMTICIDCSEVMRIGRTLDTCTCKLSPASTGKHRKREWVPSEVPCMHCVLLVDSKADYARSDI
ncbi:hypothetical protein CRG98_004628 [Punica granatum]|uniref:Uncharacterized protein n=1 Tax=Punica granatum TaxID=22663 RepID=A0A2I0L3Z5_PUNGR|nr:hypothetical protein CRG98_004628 [Punica granatum]